MSDFKKSVFSILQYGQELSLGDKLLASKEINKFLKDWKDATGKEAQPAISTLEIFSIRLTNFGYKMPTIESWLKDDMELINGELIKRRKSVFRERSS